MLTRLAKIAVPVVLAIVAVSAFAGEGRIPVWQYPTVINAPGKYVVTRNIASGGGPAPVIDILVHDVDIDINGFTLDASGGPAPVINIADDIVDVVIRNGFLVGGSHGVERGSAAGTLGRRVVLEDLQVKDADTTAIHLWSIGEVVIRRVNIIDPANHGIWLDRTGSSGFTNGLIEHCAIRLPAGSTDGIHVDNGSSLAVRHNRIETPSNHGIHLLASVACLVGENTISDADGNGIYLERSVGTKVYNNVVSRGETNGIFLDLISSDNLLLDNMVRQCGLGGAAAHPGAGGHGIVVDGDRNHVENNTTNDNDGCGLLFNGNANTFGRNMARGNDPAGAGFCGPCATGLFPPESCDNGAGNDTFGDNLIPGPPPF